ncbi:MAG: hypothetical protein ABUL60_31260 [Myxococcales bacterium]
MFQVIPEPEFEVWYQSLPEPLAEEVTTAIDVAASASALLVPDRLSRMLLWFDGTGSGTGTDLGVPGLRYLPALAQLPAAQARSYLLWHQEALLCLDSAQFRERLQRLTPELAAQALSQVERLKRRLQAARVASSWSSWQRSRTLSEALDEPSGIRRAFLDLLRLMGLEPQAVLGSGSGLRELCIDNVQPQLRVLFGLDFPAKRLIAILGEALDRRYYGDSVRRAEQSWRAYCKNTASRGVSP